MNKDQLVKSVGQWVRLRPIPRRFEGGPQGRELERLDRQWKITGASPKDGVTLQLPETGHGFTLNWDNILGYDSDPIQGDAFLTLKLQVHMGGRDIWVEPVSMNRATTENEGQRKCRAILAFKGKMVTLTQMNTGRAAHLLGPKRGSLDVEVFDCTEFSVVVGRRGQDAFSRTISLTDIEICLNGEKLELQEQYK